MQIITTHTGCRPKQKLHDELPIFTVVNAARDVRDGDLAPLVALVLSAAHCLYWENVKHWYADS